MTGARRDRSLLLFSGSNDRAVHAIARAAAACVEPFRTIAWGNDDRLLLGTYRDTVDVIRRSPELSAPLLAEWLGAARTRAGDRDFVVVPSSEYLNTFLLGLGKDFLDSQGLVVPLIDGPDYRALSDKASATTLFRDAGLRTPLELPAFDPASLPLVAKPRRNVMPDGRVLYPRLLESRVGLEAFLREERTDEYFPQEFIAGQSRYLLAYFARSSDEVFVSSQQNLAQQPDGKSIVLAATDDFHDSAPARATIAMLRARRFRGFVMVEFIEDGRGPCFIEVNPRPWGPLQLCVDHRCGIVESFLGDVLHDDPRRFERIWQQKPTRARYLWFGGMLQTLRSHGRTRWTDASLVKRSLDLAASLFSDVYLRADSWRVFLKEARTT